jgi:hypothetical protein
VNATQVANQIQESAKLELIKRLSVNLRDKLELVMQVEDRSAYVFGKSRDRLIR